MARPLQTEDPGELGPFRLDSRLEESPAGIVYLGADAQGMPVEVALLTTAAAGDAAARDRFRTAVTAETPQPGPGPRRQRRLGPGEPAPVVAAFVDGFAPWVATAHAEGLPGASRFLEPVLLKHDRGWRRGPQFVPHWLSGPRRPAVLVPAPGGPPPDDSRTLAAAVASLAALLALLALLLGLLFACEPSQSAPPPPPPPTPTLPGRPPPQPSPSTTTATPSPTNGSHRPSRRPTPTSSGGSGTVNPAGGR